MEESREAALSGGNPTRADEQLNDEQSNNEKDLVSLRQQRSSGHPECWQWVTTTGTLRMPQQKYEEAEQCYKDALALRTKSRRTRILLRLAHL
jgi:uncharacterized protein HemY